jgi:hypothetical protein
MVAVIPSLPRLGMMVCHEFLLLGQMIRRLQPKRDAVLGPFKESKERLKKRECCDKKRKRER